MQELTAFCWTCFGSEGLHRKPVSFLSSSARQHCHSVHSPFLSVFLQRGFGADSGSEHHGDSIWEQSHRAVQLQMSECFIARGICFSALAGDGEQECGVDRVLIQLWECQEHRPESQTPSLLSQKQSHPLHQPLVAKCPAQYASPVSLAQ